MTSGWTISDQTRIAVYSVDSTEDLTRLIADARLADRTLVRCTGVHGGLTGVWRLDKESTAIVDGWTVVATLSKTGRWVYDGPEAGGER